MINVVVPGVLAPARRFLAAALRPPAAEPSLSQGGATRRFLNSSPQPQGGATRRFFGFMGGVIRRFWQADLIAIYGGCAILGLSQVMFCAQVRYARALRVFFVRRYAMRAPSGLFLCAGAVCARPAGCFCARVRYARALRAVFVLCHGMRAPFMRKTCAGEPKRYRSLFYCVKCAPKRYRSRCYSVKCAAKRYRSPF